MNSKEGDPSDLRMIPYGVLQSFWRSIMIPTIPRLNVPCPRAILDSDARHLDVHCILDIPT